ncbi:MAG: cyclomaltodextrinase [Clostridiales bacterium]|nr:cyclomaltodextrinase [Clostridiales bacterium]
MWYESSVFYQIYPLGFCGAPFENDGILKSRILKVIDWIPHLKKLGINAIYFSPVFESDTHGYNTRDYGLIDKRLGTNEDFKKVVDELHKNGIKVVLDGVFNHVGRGFWAFKDVQEKKWDSPYKDWFHLSFEGNSNYNDGFWYEGWEGNFDLVKLNLRNGEVIDHILDKVKYWTDYFDIDGLRLDVAYCLDRDFLKRLRRFTDELKPEFLLLGELLHGDYKQWVNGEMLHSCTNYACYKGLFSSFNCMNMFEIINTLIQQFGPENWSWFKGLHLMSFVDNHDVTRIASNLNDQNHLPLIYTLSFTMPGFPCVYYGSEWGATGRKEEGDPSLRLSYDKPLWNDLTTHISKLSKIKKEHSALNYGSFRSVLLTNHQCVFERNDGNERILVAINAGNYEYTAHFDAGCGQAQELLTDTVHDFGGGSVLKPYSCEIWKMEH